MDLKSQVAEHAWYHSLDLPGGIVTPGFYDIRSTAQHVLPTSLEGKRCLDAAMSNGFWSFEMEKRGAAEVVGIDLVKDADRDWQKPWLAPEGDLLSGGGFNVAKAALGSSVTRVDCSIYDANPDLLGSFDFVFVGSVLLHLRDPVRALRALQSVTTGELRSFEVWLWWATKLHRKIPVARMAIQDDSRWWTPNSAAHRQWLVAAGFEVTGCQGGIKQPFGAGIPHRVPARNYRHPITAMSRQTQFIRGVPSGWVSGRPIS